VLWSELGPAQRPGWREAAIDLTSVWQTVLANLDRLERHLLEHVLILPHLIQIPAVLDRRRARRPQSLAGRDRRMAPPGAELKNDLMQENNMASHQIA
jgi:hypothetical protein